MAAHGLQPVWVKIENRSALPYWFMPAFLDRDFYSAREAAYLFHSGSSSAAASQIERDLTERQVKVQLRLVSTKPAAAQYASITNEVCIKFSRSNRRASMLVVFLSAS